MFSGRSTNSHTIVYYLMRTVLQMIPFAFIFYLVLHLVHDDYGYFYYAFQTVLHRLPWRLLYNVTNEHQWFSVHHLPIHLHNQYVYPPQFAVLFSWMGVFPYHIAVTLWSVFSILGFLWGSRMIQHLTNLGSTRLRRVTFYVTVLLNFAFWWDLIIGNANWLIFLLISGSLYVRYKKQQSWWAGVPLGLAIVFKLTPACFLLYLLIRKEWKWIASTLGTMSLSTLVSAFFLGWSPIWYYTTHVTQLADTSMKIGAAPYNSSLIGVLTLWQHRGFLAWSNSTIHSVYAVYVLVVIAVATLLFLVNRSFTDHKFGKRTKELSMGRSIETPMGLPTKLPTKLTMELRWDLPLGILLIVLLPPLLEGPHLITAWIAVWILLGKWWDNHRNPGVSKAEKLVVGLVLASVLLVLSPLGWFLRAPIPTEYFWLLLLLAAVSIRFVQHNLRNTVS